MSARSDKYPVPCEGGYPLVLGPGIGPKRQLGSIGNDGDTHDKLHFSPVSKGDPCVIVSFSVVRILEKIPSYLSRIIRIQLSNAFYMCIGHSSQETNIFFELVIGPVVKISLMLENEPKYLRYVQTAQREYPKCRIVKIVLKVNLFEKVRTFPRHH